MEIVTYLSEIKRMNDYKEAKTDAFLCGSEYSLTFRYSRNELKEIVDYCKANKLKVYVSIDAFIFDEEVENLKDYLDFLRTLDIDGIYFNDLSLIELANDFNLIFDPTTLLTNSIDTEFLLGQNIGVTLAREITLDEIKNIVNKLNGKVDLQVFGHCKMSYSKRKFLTNYFNFLDKKVEVIGKRDIRLIEEKRDYKLPIIEDEYGSRIYTDYVLEMFDELNTLKNSLNRVILDDTFIDSDVICDALRIINGETINIKDKYPNVSFSKGFLYQKTNKTKDE